jgi:hypothetical protein
MKVDPHAVRSMEAELEEILGEPVSREEAERALTRRTPTLTHWLREQQLLLGLTVGAAVVVGAIASLATGSWLMLVLALVVHATATLFVGYLVMRVAADGDKPDPMVVARLQHEGVDDPETKLNLALEAHRGGSEAPIGSGGLKRTDGAS